MSRIIIGEGPIAGLPISAEEFEYDGAVVEGTIRWLKRDSYFVLQQFRRFYLDGRETGRWEDVACSVGKAELSKAKEEK